jgi:hypothetical protein
MPQTRPNASLNCVRWAAPKIYLPTLADALSREMSDLQEFIHAQRMPSQPRLNGSIDIAGESGRWAIALAR